MARPEVEQYSQRRVRVNVFPNDGGKVVNVKVLRIDLLSLLLVLPE